MLKKNNAMINMAMQELVVVVGLAAAADKVVLAE
jgi:hypothetical protein